MTPAAWVLLIDDDPAQRSFVSFTLAEAGFGVLSAPDLDTALMFLEHDEVSLVVLGSILSAEQRSEFVRVSRERRMSRLPVVALSPDDASTAVATMDVDEYVSRRRDPDELVTIVRRHAHAL